MVYAKRIYKLRGGYLLIEVSIALAVLLLFVPIVFDSTYALSHIGIDGKFVEMAALHEADMKTMYEGYAQRVISANVASTDSGRVHVLQTDSPYFLDACRIRPNAKLRDFSHIASPSASLPPHALITDIEIAGNSVYVGTDSPVHADHDLYVYKLLDGELQLKASYNTGPGILGLTFGSGSLYAANDSIRFPLHVYAGVGTDHMTIEQKAVFSGTSTLGHGSGRSVALTSNEILLGTTKSTIEEFFIVSKEGDVLQKYEIGHQVNSIVFTEGRVYLGTPGLKQVRIHDIHELLQGNHDEYASYAYPGSTVQSVQSIATDGAYVVVGRSVGGFNVESNHEIFVHDAVSHEVIASIDIGATVHDVYRYGHLLFAAVGTPKNELRIYNIHDITVGIRGAYVAFPLSGEVASFDCRGELFIVGIRNAGVGETTLHFFTINHESS